MPLHFLKCFFKIQYEPQTCNPLILSFRSITLTPLHLGNFLKEKLHIYCWPFTMSDTRASSEPSYTSHSLSTAFLATHGLLI